MRNVPPYVLLCVIFFAGCNNQSNESIHFEPLQGTMFNFMADSTFTPPDAQTAAERKRAFDSCMGEGYEPNAIFMKTKDTFYIGCIVNRNTMKIVHNVPFQNLPRGFMASSLVKFIERPCYDKIPLHVSPSTFMNRKIEFVIPGLEANLNKEINELFNDSKSTDLEVSYWVNVEFTDALGKILDTTQNVELLSYKKNLTDSSNMILVRSTSVTKIGFYIKTDNVLPVSIQKELAKKPLINMPGTDIRVFLSIVNDHMFKVEFNGIFQIMGQFMQAKLE